MSDEKLTKFQTFALKEIQKHSHAHSGEWFNPYNLYYMVKRPGFTCDLLFERGYLERRLIDGDFEYRLKRDSV